MKKIIKKIAPAIITFALMGLSGHMANANVTLNGLTWGDPFTNLVFKSKTDQLNIVTNTLGGHVATWNNVLISADTNNSNSVDPTELSTFLTLLGFPTVSTGTICSGQPCVARLQGNGEYVQQSVSGQITTTTFGAPSSIVSDANNPAIPSLDPSSFVNVGMLWIVNTPEPGMIGLLGFSLAGLAFLRNRQKS